MLLHMAVRTGCRIRHRDWPPFHYAQLQPTGNGEWRLCRMTPHSDTPPTEVQVDALGDDSDWKILDMPPE